MAKRKILTKLEISEISGVDYPAQRDALHAITKRGMPDFEVETRIYKSERALKLKVLLLQVLDLKKSLRVLAKAYNPDQDRADDGKWTDGGGSSSGGRKDGKNGLGIGSPDIRTPAGRAEALRALGPAPKTPGKKESLSAVKDALSSLDSRAAAMRSSPKSVAATRAKWEKLQSRIESGKLRDSDASTIRGLMQMQPRKKAAELIETVTKVQSSIESLLKAYNPDQDRDESGKWTAGGGGGKGGSKGHTGPAKWEQAQDEYDSMATHLEGRGWEVMSQGLGTTEYSTKINGESYLIALSDPEQEGKQVLNSWTVFQGAVDGDEPPFDLETGAGFPGLKAAVAGLRLKKK